MKTNNNNNNKNNDRSFLKGNGQQNTAPSCSVQMTPTSSSCPQSLSSGPRWGQSIMCSSCPVHITLSIHTIPCPGPNSELSTAIPDLR